jgi:CHASE2 domain-containing sensor protein
LRFPVRAELVEARKLLFQQALKSLRAPPATSVLIGILISLAIIGLRSFGILESLELAAYDLCIRLGPDVSRPDPATVLFTDLRGFTSVS